MPATTCPNPEELHAYAVGLLDDERSEEVAQHLDRCDACQACIATLDDADDTLVTQLKRAPADIAVIDESHCIAALDRARSLAGDSAERKPPHDNVTRSLSGKSLGEYRLLEEIGRGGMGRVYKALQTKLDRIVAVKVLPYSRHDDDRAIARFEREMKAIGRLDHPHIVHAYDAREIDGKPVLVMEFVEGMDLSRVLQSLGRVKVADACELVRQAALGLAYAHENGLIHRDVKPSNLMLTPQGRVKLLDLGLARFEHSPSAADEVTGAGQPMGTADYIAPEQVSDSRAVDVRADIYSLGCTLYKLLVGQAPFAGSECRGTFDKLTAHVSTAAPSIRHFDPSLPVGLVELLESMLAKSPDDRPTTPAAVISALEPYCAGHDLAALQSMAAEAERQRNRQAYNGPVPPIKETLSAGQYSFARAPLLSSGRFWGLAAALLLVVGGAGFALGVIITIERHGEKTSIEVPDGSTVAIGDRGNVDVRLPEGNDVAVAQTAADLPSMQGTWRVVSRSGKSTQSLLEGTDARAWQTVRIDIDAKRIRICGDAELPASYEYQINRAATPKMIDLLVYNDELLGVYELDGQQLRLCFDWSSHRSMNMSHVRPDRVWAGLSSNQEMLVLERTINPTAHPDEAALLGAWEIESIRGPVKDMTAVFGRNFAASMGKVFPGRSVEITPDQLIMRGATKAEMQAHGVTPSSDPSTKEKQIMQDEPFQYVIDAQRNRISLWPPYGRPCRGIYRLQGNQLTILLGGDARPDKLADAPRDGEMMLQLKRLSGSPENESSKSTSTDDLSDDELLSCDTAARAIIAKYDTDGDEMLTWPEWHGGGIDYSVPDFDDNDRADHTELTYWVRSIIRHYKPLHRTRDRNRDGVLTVDEWSKLKGNISSADANNDGRITTMELAFYFTIRDPAHRNVVLSSIQSPRRLPVMMVRSRDSRWKGDCFWPVDAEGILLPSDEFSAGQTTSCLRLEAANQVPTGPVGTPFGGPAVAGAARLAVILGDEWKSMGLQWIVVVKDRPDAGAEPTEPTYVLLANGGDPTAVLSWLDDKTTRTLQIELKPDDQPPTTLVFWGHAPPREFEGEPAAGQKIALLREFVKQYGPLDRLAAATVVDLVEGDTASQDSAAAVAPAQLDFRIAITRASGDNPTVSEVVGKLIEQLTLSDKTVVGSDSRYQWLVCDEQIWGNITSRKDELISTMHNAKLHLLVSNEPDGTMLSSDQGDRAWKIVSARATKDAVDHPAISIELDEAGGRRLGELTAQNLNRPLAMIIDNRVVMAPTIHSKITNQVQITGQFSLENLDRLVKSLKGVEQTRDTN